MNEITIIDGKKLGSAKIRTSKAFGADGSGGTLEGGAQSQPCKLLYKNPLEIPKGIPR